MQDGLLSAIVVNYSSHHYLAECIASLRAEGVATIVVVENGSPAPDRVAAELAVARFENVVLVSLEQNVGFGAGVNAGFRALKSAGSPDKILIVNPDSMARPGSIASLVDAFSLDDGAIYCPRIVKTNNSGKEVDWYSGGAFLRGQGRVVMRAHRRKSHTSESTLRVSFVTGAFLLVSASVYEQIGGFREDYFMYWEDVDFSMKALRAGVSLYYVPASRVWHKVGGSSGTSVGKSTLYHYYMQRNRVLFLSDLLGRRPRFAMLAPVALAFFTWSLFGAKPRLYSARYSALGFMDGVRNIRGASSRAI